MESTLLFIIGSDHGGLDWVWVVPMVIGTGLWSGMCRLGGVLEEIFTTVFSGTFFSNNSWSTGQKAPRPQQVSRHVSGFGS